MVALQTQPLTHKASIGRSVALGLRHIVGLMPPSPSRALRWRCDVGNPATSCVCGTLVSMLGAHQTKRRIPAGLKKKILIKS